MDRQLLQSSPARVVALSFVLLILLGNYWFALTVIGQPVPSWFPIASRAAMFGAIGGGLWLAAMAVRNWLDRTA